MNTAKQPRTNARAEDSAATMGARRAVSPPTTWNLRLYVAGDSLKSQTALTNLRRLCEQHLSGRYSIEVVDIKHRPDLAKADDIRALPTLVRRTP